MSRGIFAYFTSERGRRVVFIGACCTTFSLFLGNFVPHTFLLNKYREVVTCYRNGVEKKLPEKVLKRLEKAYDLLGISPYERKIIKPFTVYGFDLFQAGSTKYRFGGILGIPVNYAYDYLSDFEKQEIRFRNELINWNTDSGRFLQEALILTEEEQIFGMCSAIMHLQTHKVLLNSLFPSMSFLFVYTLGNGINQKLNLYARPRGVRMVLYTILGLFGLGTWMFMKDFTQVQYEVEIDKQLCDLGPVFIEAGASFYDKILKKNIALRNLLGGQIYTAKGNEIFLLRQKSLPITLHKAYFDERLKEKESQGQPANVLH